LRRTHHARALQCSPTRRSSDLVAVGIVDGVGYGENTKAAIITRGLVEMTDFAVAYGAEPETLQGLAGLGDLIATCQSPLSRNNTDRKSTRLNSSHVKISYAVFC